MATGGQSRRGSLSNNRGQARLGYIYASPLVQLNPLSRRKDKMELLDTAQVTNCKSELPTVLHRTAALQHVVPTLQLFKVDMWVLMMKLV